MGTTDKQNLNGSHTPSRRAFLYLLTVNNGSFQRGGSVLSYTCKQTISVFLLLGCKQTFRRIPSTSGARKARQQAPERGPRARFLVRVGRFPRWGCLNTAGCLPGHRAFRLLPQVQRMQHHHTESDSTDKDGRKKEARGLWEKNCFLSFLVESISSQCVTFPALSAGTRPA